MINILKKTAALSAPLAAILFGLTMPVFSQAPTDAQRNAIRSECRSDYEAHCASIPPGGAASLQCLQKNISGLSPGCQTAVRAVEAPAAPKAESAPAAPKAESTLPAAAPAKPAAETTPPPAAKAAASTTAKKPTSAQAAAIRSACRSDYQKVCAGVPTGGSAALQCLEQNKSKVSAPCQQAVGAAGGGAAAAAAPRGDFRLEVCVWRRCSLALRRRRTRRRTDRAMPGDKGSLALAGLQGSSEPVRCAIDSDRESSPRR